MYRAHAEERGLLGLEARAVGTGLVGGFAAGLPMGFLLQFGTDVLPVLATVAGASSVAVGWAIHLVIGAAYGALFAAVVAYPAVHGFVAEFDVGEYTLVGITYGVSHPRWPTEGVAGHGENRPVSAAPVVSPRSRTGRPATRATASRPTA